MRKILLLLPLMGALLFACQPEPETNTEDATPAEEPSEQANVVEPTLAKVPVPGLLSPEDSIRVAEIDEYTQSVIMLKSHEDRGFAQQKVKPKGGNDKDNAHLITYNGDVVRAVTSLFPEGGETRNYIFFREGKPVHYKHREWYPDIEEPYAKEVIGYFEGDEIISLQERRIPLQKGERPNGMLKLPLRNSKMDKDSFIVALNEDWKAMEERLNLD